MNELEFIKETALEAGKLAKSYFRREDLLVEYKSAKDLVTEADKHVERFILEQIAKTYPEDSTFGEEYGKTKGNHREWIIDPIDGTGSFAQGQPFFSISIAMYSHEQAQIAAVVAPILDEIYYAEKGKGAWCNGKKISVSKTNDLSQSMLATGFACLRSDLQPNNIPFLNAILPRIRDLRRFGSAAIDLCYVACGRLDGFWELNLKPYDIAAGKLIVEEAGGVYSDFDNKNHHRAGEVLATNGLLHSDLNEVIRLVKADF